MLVKNSITKFQLFQYLFFVNFSSQTGPIDILRDGVKVDNDEDLESEDLIIQLDFDAIKTKRCFISEEGKDNSMSFEGNALFHKKSKEILIEPLVETYLNLKWQSLKGWWYGYRLLFFLAFGVCLTLMISFIVEMNSTCEYEAKINNEIKESELVEISIRLFNPISIKMLIILIFVQSISYFGLLVFDKLKIKPCGLGSRIQDMEAESYN